MVLGNELFEGEALSFNDWEKEQCRMSLEKPLGSEPSWGEVPLQSVPERIPREQHTLQLGAGGGISLPSPVCSPCVGRDWETPLSVPRCASVSETLQMGFSLTPNAIIHQDLIKPWKQAQEQAPLHHLQHNRAAGNQRLTALYLICETSSKIFIEIQQVKSTTKYSKTH